MPKRFAVAAALLAALVVPQSARATAVVIVAAPGGALPAAGRFLSPVSVTPVGGPMFLANGDPIGSHNVVADGVYGSKSEEWCTSSQKQSNTCPIFWSQTIGASETTPILGLGQLERAETYPFVCTLHPWMTGTLVAV